VHCKNILIYIQKDATVHSLFYLETALHAVTVWQIPDAVDTVVCTPDEQFSDKINRVTLHLAGYILECFCYRLVGLISF
jgi:hypothetical protein